ncbi:MAG: hypothetical protein LBV15_00940, partial [Planctomycetota bacterium]|nr:hypothetical protein [Planctomycetota bacterium]
GIGNSAYSVIEQGRVEALLAAKPADRRAIFEEAAGIARFRVQRRETLARLERIEQHLTRAGDRLLEKEGLIRRVSAQAASARRHQRLSRERDAVRTHLYRRQRAALTETLQTVRTRREALESELDGVKSLLSDLGLRFVRLREEEASLDSRRESAARSAAENQEAISALRLDQANVGNRLAALEGEIARGNERRTELSARWERLSSQDAAAAAGLEEAEKKSEELERRFGEQDRERGNLLRLATETEQRVTSLRNRIIDLNRRRQELSAGIARLEAEERSAAARLAELTARRDRSIESEAAAGRATTAAAEAYRLAADGFAAAADRLAAFQARRRELESAAAGLRAGERAEEAEMTGLASRKSVLEELEKSLDGAFEGVKNVLLASRRAQGSCPGVVGLSSDLIRVPERLALAVETILGSSAQDIVVETARDAQAAIEYLKAGRLGRATFLPLDRIQPRRRLDRSLVRLPGAVGEAADLVSCDAGHASVVEHLLAGILVVENLDIARELSRREARGVKIVTLEGDVISPSGAMTGGHGRQGRPGLVRRRSELDALEVRLAEAEARLADKSRRRREAEAELAEAAAGIAGLEREMAEAGRSEAGLTHYLAAARSECARLAGERAGLEGEIQVLSGPDGSQGGGLAGAKNELAAAEAEMSGLEGEITAGVEAQRQAREAVDRLGLDFATLSGERSEALAKARELAARRRELADEIARCREEMARPGISLEQAAAEMAGLRERRTELENREADLLRLRDELAAAAADLGERLNLLKAGVEDLRRGEREGQTQDERLREGLSQLERQEVEARLRLENVREKAREELGMELEDPTPAA